MKNILHNISWSFFLFSSVIHPQTMGFNVGIITRNDGLSHNSGLSLIQDKNQFIWIGTQNGLNRYDGYKFTHFKNDPKDSLSVSGNYINSLFEDSEGCIWVGTNKGGLNKFDKFHTKFEVFKNDPGDSASLGVGSVYSICEDKFGNILIGVNPQGLYALDKSTNNIRKIFLPGESTGISFRVYSIFKDSRENVWVGTSEGLFVLNYSRAENNNIEAINIIGIEGKDHRKISGEVMAFSQQSDSVKQIIWVAFWRDIYRFEYQDINQISHKKIDIKIETQSPNHFWSILVDSYNYLWVGTYNQGILYADLNSAVEKVEFTALSESSGKEDITQYVVRDIFECKQGIIFAGTEENGILKITRNKLKVQTLRNEPDNSNSLSDNFITSLYKDHKKNIWAGTKFGGLNKIEQVDTKNHVYRITRYSASGGNSMLSNYVTDIFSDHNDNIWISNWSLQGGLIRYNQNTKQFEQFQNRKNVHNSLSENQVRAITQDFSGKIWIGFSEKGLDRYDYESGTFKNYSMRNDRKYSISDNTVVDLLVSRTGTLWVGTLSGGLNRYIKEVDGFVSYKMNMADRNSISSNRVSQIYEDHAGLLWLCTGNGLDVFDPEKETFKKFNLIGLDISDVYCVTQDSANSYWIATGNALVKLDSTMSKMTSFGISDGLPSLDFSNRALMVLNNNEILAGTSHGLMIINNHNINYEYNAPEMAITSFEVAGNIFPLDTVIIYKKNIELNYTQNTFSLEFAALEYQKQEKVQYAYLFDGLSSNWVFSDKRRYISFNNIAPGNYNFKASSILPDGSINKNFAQVKITIAPPFWMTTWFRLLSAILLITFLFYTIHFYISIKYKRKLRALELEQKIRDERERISNELHDNIGANLTNIATGLEITNKYFSSLQKQLIKKNIGDLEYQIRSTINDLRNTIWSLSIATNTFSELINQVQDFIKKRRMYASGVNFQLNNSLETNYKLTPNSALNVLRIIQESIHNALKYAQAENIFIHFENSGNGIDNEINITILDDGIGFTMSEVEKSGLMIMQNRAQKIGAQLDIDTKPGKGVRISLKLLFPSSGD